MQGYTRVTKLNNIGGRANYISNPARQEEIVVKSAPIDWKPYVDYELTHQKSKEKNNQGREIVFSIPNEWYTLPKSELREKVQHLCETAVGKSTDLQWAVHWNNDRTNMHVHVIFSERTRIPEAERKVYDRDVYLTEDGKVARNKAQRARDENGNIKPPVHRKGDVQGEFSSKNTMYLQKTFNKQVRTKLEKEMTARYGVVFDEKNPLKQFHHGKGSDSETIKKKNEIIKETNYWLSIFNEIKYDKTFDKFLSQFKEYIKDKKFLVGYYDAATNSFRSKWFTNIDNAYAFFLKTKDTTRETLEKNKNHILSVRAAEQHTATAPVSIEKPVEPEIDRETIKAAVIAVEQAKINVEAAKKGVWWTSDNPHIDYAVINLPANLRNTVNKLAEAQSKKAEVQHQIDAFPYPAAPDNSFFNFKKKKEQEQYARELAAWREQTADLRNEIDNLNTEISNYFTEIKQHIEPEHLIKNYRGGGYTIGQLENNQIKANNLTAADIKQLEHWTEIKIKDKYQPAADREQQRANNVKVWQQAQSDLSAAQERLKNLTKDIPEEQIREVEREYAAEKLEIKKSQTQEKEITAPKKTKSERER